MSSYSFVYYIRLTSNNVEKINLSFHSIHFFFNVHISSRLYLKQFIFYNYNQNVFLEIFSYIISIATNHKRECNRAYVAWMTYYDGEFSYKGFHISFRNKQIDFMPLKSTCALGGQYELLWGF